MKGLRMKGQWKNILEISNVAISLHLISLQYFLVDVEKSG